MSQFIDRIKAADAARVAAEQLNSEVRLHNARVIKAKAPDFWALTKTNVEEFCRELAGTGRKCHTEYATNGFLLKDDGPLPRKRLQASLNIEGFCVQLLSGTQNAFASEPHLDITGIIDIKASNAEDLILKYAGREWTSPDELAEYLISLVMPLPRLDR